MYRVDLIEMLPAMQEMMNSGGSVTFTVEGNSMYPTMTGGRDSVTLQKPVSRLRKYDIPLYRRASGQFVLHRVVRVTDGGYVMCGDNQYTYEYGITDENIIGIVSSFTRNGRLIDVNGKAYRLYAMLTCCAIAKFLKHAAAYLKAHIKKLFGR